MRLVNLRKNVKKGGRLKLWHLTDLHVGAPDFAEDELKRCVDLIRQDPEAVWTLGGDGGDLIKVGDRRYKPDELSFRYRQATDLRYATMEHLLELLEPIKEKNIGICDGNHEEKYDHLWGGKFGCELACNLGCPDNWVDYRGLIRLEVGLTKTQSTRVLIDLMHGWQAGRLVGAPQNQAERELSFTDADVALRGHSHNPWAHSWITLSVSGPPRPRIVRRQRTVINGGTWRYGYRDNLKPVNPDRLSEVEGSVWAERKGYRPSPIGCPVLILRFKARSGTQVRGRNIHESGDIAVEHTVLEGRIDEETLGL